MFILRKIKKGDVVGRISYGKDIIFVVDSIINLKNTRVAILKGLTMRIKADSPLDDLEIIDKRIAKSSIKNVENRIISHLNKYMNPFRRINNFGLVLHLDGDNRYSQKSARYYRSLGVY